MKINNFTPVNFRKVLVAKAKVGEIPKVVPVSIYKLDKFDDIEVFLNALEQKDWRHSYYLCNMIADFNPINSGLEYYAMEDENGNLISYCQLDDRKKMNLYVDFIETAPKLSTNNANRPLRYVGETMMAFIASLAKDRKKGVLVPAIAPRGKTLSFYFNTCGFEQVSAHKALMRLKNLGRILGSNQAHTDSEINFVECDDVSKKS